MPSLLTRAQRAINVFLNKDPTPYNHGQSSSRRPDRIRLTRGNERSIVTTILNRMALDFATIDIVHAQLDKKGRFLKAKQTGLNNCLNLEANIDQNAFQFKHDIALSMFNEGVIAIVPTKYTTPSNYMGPIGPSTADIDEMRVAQILEWYPKHVKVRLYDDDDGKKKDIILPKKHVSIVENPFFAVMNEYNSTLQRLTRKLALLDYLDEQKGSGKLDLIIQLPYTVKSTTRKEQAEQRQKEIEMQLVGSSHGIAYIDSTEKVTQLNRSIDNNLLSQIESLTKMLYDQFGITNEVLNGTANESTMLNYFHRAIEPALTTVALEIKRKMLTKTARTQAQDIMFFNDHFKLVPLEKLAELADKLTRNEILSPNEVRQILGLAPDKNPKSDQLANRNMKNQNGEPVSEDPQEIEETDNFTEEDYG